MNCLRSGAFRWAHVGSWAAYIDLLEGETRRR